MIISDNYLTTNKWQNKNRPDLSERNVRANSRPNNWKYDVTFGRDGPVPVSLRYVWEMVLEWPVKERNHRL